MPALLGAKKNFNHAVVRQMTETPLLAMMTTQQEEAFTRGTKQRNVLGLVKKHENVFMTETAQKEEPDRESDGLMNTSRSLERGEPLTPPGNKDSFSYKMKRVNRLI